MKPLASTRSLAATVLLVSLVSAVALCLARQPASAKLLEQEGAEEADDEAQTISRPLLGAKLASVAAASALYNSGQELHGRHSNIARAKVQMEDKDLKTAAGHHYHHKHSVHGWLKMGAHTGKKGAFGWHAKYPVGGKGRR